MSAQFDFTGKVVLITGSSSGIGAATAVQFSKSGANVVVTGRNQQKVQEVAKQCLQVSPSKSEPLEVVADVTIEADMIRLVNETIKHFGRLDVLVNNAGAGVLTAITDQNYYQNYQKSLQINLNSCIFLTHICFEYLEKTKGNIINNSSVAGIRALKNFSPYHMAKCSMIMFTKCMASELAHRGIRVNAIVTGTTKTNMAISSGMSIQESDQLFDDLAKDIPIGRYAQPNDIAYSILYLASDLAAFITGANLLCDGGVVAANNLSIKHFDNY